MLTYIFDKTKKAPLYIQLYEKMRDDILSGAIAGGDKLPSKRAFAEHLGISKVTVEAAYSLLISEGYVYSLEKRGYYAEKDVGLPEHRGGEVPVSRETESERFLIDLSSNIVPPGQFPFTVWAKLMRNVCLDYRDELLLPMPYNGAKCLREAISGYLYEQRGMSVSPDRILIGSGSEYLYGVIVKLLGKDRVYAAEDPAYRRIHSSYAHSGVRCISVPVEKEGVDIKAPAVKKADVLHISPSHNFPTGIAASPKRRREITDALSRGEIGWIIEDDFDSELRFSGKPVPTLYSADRTGRVIYMNTFSKTIAPSIKISYLVIPDALAEKCREEVSHGGCPVPSFEQYTLAEFISGGFFERHISRNRKYYRTLRDRLLEVYYSSALADKSAIEEADAGLHFFINLKTDKGDDVIKKQLAQEGIKSSFLSDYLSKPDAQSAHRLLVNYSGLSPADFSQVLNALNKLI